METNELTNSKKKVLIPIVILIILIAALVYVFFLRGGSQDIFPNHVMTYFECSENKEDAINELCGQDTNPSICESKIITTHAIYLSKSGKTTDYELVGKKKYDSLGNSSDLQILSEEDRINLFYDFLTTDTISEYLPTDLKILKSEKGESMIEKYSNDEVQYSYLKNIFEYKKADKAEDCDKITSLDLNLRNIFLKDVCQLTFIEDLDLHCRTTSLD